MKTCIHTQAHVKYNVEYKAPVREKVAHTHVEYENEKREKLMFAAGRESWNAVLLYLTCNK